MVQLSHRSWFYLHLTNHLQTERDALWLLSGIFSAAVIAAVYGLVQYSGYTLLPHPQQVRGGPSSMTSFMENKNYLAGFLTYTFFPGPPGSPWGGGIFAIVGLFRFKLTAVLRRNLRMIMASALVGAIVLLLFLVPNPLALG